MNINIKELGHFTTRTLYHADSLPLGRFLLFQVLLKSPPVERMVEHMQEDERRKKRRRYRRSASDDVILEDLGDNEEDEVVVEGSTADGRPLPSASGTGSEDYDYEDEDFRKEEFFVTVMFLVLMKS